MLVLGYINEEEESQMTSSNSVPEFKVGIVGPTRVGKTSLIAAVLQDSQHQLAGSPVTLRPANTGTEKRLSKYRRDLQGSFNAKELVFHSGALAGTQEPFTFELTLTTGHSNTNINMHFLDFPGGWLDPEMRPDGRKADWEKCVEWINESSILLIPIDATVLMEAEEARHKRLTPSLLAIPNVSDLVRDWAKIRQQQMDQPALIVFCPLKCESYFNDNGWGVRDGSKGLLSRIEHNYASVIEAVKKEAPHVQIRYCPIDTIGCVEIKKALWHENASLPSGYELDVKYKIRTPAELRVKGADSILLNICRQVMKVIETSEMQKEKEAIDKATHAKVAADQARKIANEAGFFDRLSDWWNDKGWDHRKDMAGSAGSNAADKDKAAKEATASINQLKAVMEILANKPDDSRVVEL